MKETEMEGRWWINGPDRPAEFGTLVSNSENRLSLIVKIPQSLSPDEALVQFVDAGKISVPDVLLGRDADNKPVTLFGCYALPGVSTGLRSYNIHVLAAVQGLEFQSWSQECIHAASLNIDLLHRWLGGKILETVDIPGDRPALRPPREDDLVFDVCSDVRMRIARCIAPSWSQDEYRWIPTHRIWVHFDKPQSLAILSNHWLPWVTRLFSLLMGTSVTCQQIDCYLDDPFAENFKGFPKEGKLITRGKKQREPHGLHTLEMLAPYPDIANQFDKIVQSWFRVASQFEPVVDLFSTVAFHSSLHSKAQFLSLVQALEVYHARAFDSKALPTEQHAQRVEAVVAGAPPEFQDWTRRKLEGANYKYLDERLMEIFERHKADAKRLFVNLTELPEKIRYTRNYLTHYNGSTNSPKYLKGRGNGSSELVPASVYVGLPAQGDWCFRQSD